MSVSIVSCPSCKSLILSDTIQCPTCHHILDEERAAAVVQDLPAVVRAGEDEMPCPDCGEMVRSGLVRCWRCGGFLREEIAETYQKMLDEPKPVTFSDSENAPVTTPDEESPPEVSGRAQSDDDDFQLADGLNLLSQEDMDKRRAEAAASLAASSEPAADPDSGVADGDSKQDAETPEAADSTDKPADEAPAESTGDPLLDIALQEEKEAASRRKDRKRKKADSEKVAMPGFVFVFCPNGHRIQVDEKYRGQTGRCPRCKSFFHVPGIDWERKKLEEKLAEEELSKQSKYGDWKLDTLLHQVDPTKLKLKPGSLEKEFQEVDLGFTADSMIVVTHGKQNAGIFSGEKNSKKREPLREEVQEHLRLEKEILDLPAAGYRLYKQEDMEKITVVQPAAYAHESMFAGVPVFGEGRIALRLPVTDQDKDVKDILFVSLSLSQFRSFSAKLEELFNITGLGQMEGVPGDDAVTEYKCHYSDRKIRAIDATEFHKADSDIKLEIIGRKCQACGLVVSEESRKKEKLGGAAGKGIAKAKCPKCTQKFGDTTLYGIEEAESSGAADEAMTESGGL